jgi:LPS sulfotransferase NodH
MCDHAAPEEGDIVVRQETRDGRDVYVLHTASGVDQYVLRTREEAVKQAVTFAKRQGVRAWLGGETQEFVLLNDVRVVDSV